MRKLKYKLTTDAFTMIVDAEDKKAFTSITIPAGTFLDLMNELTLSGSSLYKEESEGELEVE